MTDKLYNLALVEFLTLKNHAEIIHEPSYSKRVFSPVFWRARDILDFNGTKDYSTEEVILLSLTGGGIGLVTILSLVLGIRKCTMQKEEEVIESEKLDIQRSYY
jgi:hypothetical protein